MADPTPNHRPAPKFTRCRTGCLRCRVRRRKCDEGKPRCRNCIDKNFDCHYGLQVTFLPKNSITVDARELQTPETDGKYKIQFVKEDPVAYNTDASAEDSPSPTPHITPAWFSSSPAKSIPTPYNPNDISISGADNESSSSGRYIDKSQTKRAHGERKIHSDKISFSDNDESAIRGLLALGSSAAVNDTSPTVGTPIAVTDFVQRSTLSPLLRECPVAPREGVPPAAPYPLSRETDMSSATESLSPNSAPIASVPEARKLELLRHYQYHVAPWLDLSDMRRPFGLTVVDIAVKSDILIHAVMELSNACAIQRLSDREYQSRPSFSSHARQLPPNRQGAGLNINSTELSLFILLDELRTLISNISTAWKNANCSGPRLQETLVQHAYGTGIESVMYWMFLRLELGIALANSASIRIPLPMSAVPNIALLSHIEDVHDRVRHYTCVALWLCGKALIFYHQESISQRDSSHQQLTDNWLQAFEELDEWYRMRPQELQPIVELHKSDPMLNSGSEFPLLLFSNAAGPFSNQIYHTAMLLLLQCKPRTALINRPHSPALSPLWHAQRICGIALNNDRRECWDPCLLASFLVAARFMTHESQQNEIMQGFDRIRELTGWDVGEYLSHVREDWSFLDGT